MKKRNFCVVPFYYEERIPSANCWKTPGFGLAYLKHDKKWDGPIPYYGFSEKELDKTRKRANKRLWKALL